MATLFGCSLSFLLRAADALDGLRFDDVAAAAVEEEAALAVEGPADDDAAAPGVEVEAPEVEGPATAPPAVATPVGCFLPLDVLSPAATLCFLPCVAGPAPTASVVVRALLLVPLGFEPEGPVPGALVPAAAAASL